MNAKNRATASGSVVTDRLVRTLAEEAERGYRPDQLHRRPGRPAMGSSAARVIPVRLDPDLEQALRERAEVDGSTASQVIRDALRAWLVTT
ncbi:MAG: ribbon-helix-helix protein, CopG family [Candidatus Nanopelagicales bacterium]